ncbi:MAG: three-Cys-motif partner protein TcmP [Calditrichia bacterium]
MNQFGGDWTKVKIEILVDYAKAYLQIMKKRKFFNLLYFDGFAGSGFITKEQKDHIQITIGAARRIVELEEPIPFDKYYFVEKDPKKALLLEENTKNAFPQKSIYIRNDDCNKKLVDLANFLRDPKNKSYRTLAYIDPCGMQVEWRSIEVLRGLNIDLWLLVPTGMGVNRLLIKSGDISAEWLNRLEKFLGMDEKEIKAYFYVEMQTLFPEYTQIKKEAEAIKKSATLYRDRLQSVFQYVSKPYELRNSTNSIMYHLFCASNNKNGIKIANAIVKKYKAYNN